jgi:hypothetical protein
MEETDVCYLTPTDRFLQQAIPNGCPAKALGASQRLTLGVQALAGNQTIKALAEDLHVSRKFVYQQAATAQTALEEAFTSSATADDHVLFHLPVTKAWLRQVALGLTLICHSSNRGVGEFCRDVLGVNLSVGTVHNILHAAMDKARPYNLGQHLGNIAIAALDEIFQDRPVLVAADCASSYCCLLSLEEHRDADTWGLRLLEMKERGFAPQATIADFATGLRAGQKLALSGVPCRGDVFHALHEVTPLVQYLENRAYEAITAHDKLEHKKTEIHKQARKNQLRQLQALGRRAFLAGQAEAKAVAVADEVALLARWLHYDIFAVSGLPYAERCALFDFILAELKAREPLCPHRIGPVHTLLKNHRTELLAFAAQLDRDLDNLAAEFQVPVSLVRELLDVQALAEHKPQRWQKEAALRQKLRHRFYALNAAVQEVADHTVRASSVIENLNSRLRNYFFLRRQLGPDYLVLLQFFLNHRRFVRSEHPERVDKSPAELLTGESHPHWLEMLGYQRFSRN